MASSSSKENAQRLVLPSLPIVCPAPSAPPSSPSTFPPLPPLPPPDASESIRKAPVSAWSELRPRKFGVRVTNTLDVERSSSTARETEIKLWPPRVLPSAQIYHDQCKSFSCHGFQTPQLEDQGTIKGNNENAGRQLQKSSGITPEDGASGADDLESVQAFSASRSASEFSLLTSSLQPGCTIWSITPEELSALAKEMDVVKREAAEPARKLSYAEASKRNLPGFAENRDVQTAGAVGVGQLIRTFKKYYGLPNLLPSGPPAHDAGGLEEKEAPYGALTHADSVPADTVDYSRIFGLSADTPTFYPRQSTDTNEFIQMLKASLGSKKVAPHMDWWPGDWKCTNCGNHVLFRGRTLFDVVVH